MQGAGRWAIAGLLCLCGVFGCAQLPSRGLFARRIKPTADESRPEEHPDDTDDADGFIAAADWNRDRVPDSRKNRENDLTATATSERTDAKSLSLDGNLPIANSTVEAPSPNRRSSSPPGAFVAPPSAREIVPNSIPSSAGLSEDQGAVVFANHETTANENSSGIELTAGQRRPSSSATGMPNPWDRFRGLTNNHDANVPATNDSANSAWSQDPRIENRRDQAPVQPRLNGNSPPDNTTGSPSVARDITQPQPWSDAFSQNAMNSGGTAPGTWPMAPGAPVTSVPPNVQWVNAEQPGFNNFPPMALNPQSLAPAGNLPLNFGAPEGAPLAIAPLTSSLELERLITQTTVEAAAVIPGDNEVSRQLYLRKHVQLRLLNLIAGQTDRALQPIPGIDSADQEFWQQMLWGLANYFDTQGMPESSERATQTITQLRIAATRLQEKARLELHNVAFCHKISGYGNYQRFKRDEFTPGQQVLLYAEVADFKSEPTPDGQFRTLMKSTLEVLEGGPTGRLVESLPLSPSEDRCRNQRRDYYHSYDFAIPQSCNAGPHTLRLRVEDQLGKKTAVTTLNFTVQ